MIASSGTANFTIFGAGGFVGQHLVAMLQGAGYEVRAVTRTDWPAPDEALGHVVYAIGLTSDFRGKPFGTVDAHVSTLSRVLRAGAFDSFLYLSSTRVYRGAEKTSEDTPLRMSPVDPDRLYDLSKLCGEALCLCLSNSRVRVARLSNVFGPGDTSENFLTAILGEVAAKGSVTLRQALGSEKDYVHVDDLCSALVHIALDGRHRIYNVAAGANTSHGQIAMAIERRHDACVTVAEGSPAVLHRPIDVTRLAGEMTWLPRTLESYLLESLAPMPVLRR